jgi:hypothetical protein
MTTETQEHSNVVGGSSAGRRYHCAASRSLEAKAPKTTSDFADRGSMLHAGIEMVLVNWPDNMKQAQPLVNELVGQNFEYSKQDPIDDELIGTKIGPALTEWFRIVKEYGLVDWWIETRTSLETVIEGAFGKIDIYAIDKKKRLHVLDWKFGDGVMVPAEENMSLMYYMIAGVYDPDVEMQKFTEGCANECFLHIVQPVVNSSQPAHDVWETTIDHCEDFLDHLAMMIEKSYEPNPQPNPGDWCRWCASKVTNCPATKQLVAASAKKKIEGMDMQEFGIFLQDLKLIESVKNDAFSFAQKQLETGVVIPGWKLVQKQASRKWKDPAEVLAYCKKSSMKQEVYLNQELKTAPQMEKLATKGTWSKKLEPMVHKVSSGVTIAAMSDKRPPVVGSLELLAHALDNANPAKADT